MTTATGVSRTLTLSACFLLASQASMASDVLFSKDTAQYRIPAIVECKSGKLIAFTDHRYDGADIGWGNHLDIVMKESRDGGKTWSQHEQMVAQGGSGKESDFHCGHGDAAVVVDRKSGEILVMCASGGISYWDSNRDKPIMMGRYYSEDEGKTWKGEEVTQQIYGLMPEVTGAFFTSGRIVQSQRIKVGSHYRIYSVLATKPRWRNYQTVMYCLAVVWAEEDTSISILTKTRRLLTANGAKWYIPAPRTNASLPAATLAMANLYWQRQRRTARRRSCSSKAYLWDQEEPMSPSSTKS